MNFYSVGDKVVETELGRRMRALRLRRNRTQQALADAVGLSLNSIKALEVGRGKLSTVIAVLRELQALEALDQFIPEVTVSPLQLAKQRGRVRRRATGLRGGSKGGSEW